MKFVELAAKLIANGPEVACVELALVLAPNVPMQPDRKLGVVPTESDGFRNSLACDHEARARQHSMLMALHDATIDTRRCAEIVAVENKVLGHVPLSS